MTPGYTFWLLTLMGVFAIAGIAVLLSIKGFFKQEKDS